jgi:hypothetical protein
MSESLFDTSFGKIVAVDAASKDRELRDFYWSRVYEDLPVAPEAHERIADEVCHHYKLTTEQYRQALGMCIADIVDIKTGAETFRYGN